MPQDTICLPVGGFGTRLQEERLRQERSRNELAISIGLAHSTISDYEFGAKASAINALAIADALGVSLRWLITGKGRKTNE